MERRRLIDNGESPSSYVADRLKENIIGQDAAIDSITTAFDKARLRDPRRPVASFMFLGPTGVGKTQTAEALADIMAVDKLNPALLRIDCAQFAQGHEVAALVGAPPGYIGYHQDPALDPDIIHQQGSVVLFDEIEKGHPKLWNYLLQIMEGGQVKLLNSGETVNFSNSTVIMTSNVGAAEMETLMGNKRIGFSQEEERPDQSKLESTALNALKQKFAPEFINRLDSIVTFNSLDDDQLNEVLDAHVMRSNARYSTLGGVALSLTSELKNHLVESSPMRKEFGARPVLRNYEKLVESSLARMAMKNILPVDGQIVADYEDEVIFYDETPEKFIGPVELTEEEWIEFLLSEDENEKVIALPEPKKRRKK